MLITKLKYVNYNNYFCYFINILKYVNDVITISFCHMMYNKMICIDKKIFKYA